MVWSQGGADYTVSPFRAGAVTIAGVVVRGFRSSSVPVTHDGCESGPHKLIALSTLSWHALPVGGSVTQHVNNQPPSW